MPTGPKTAEGKLRLFVAIDRTSKFAFVELHCEAGQMIAAQFLCRRLKTLRGLTSYEYICKCWTNKPERFSPNPHH